MFLRHWLLCHSCYLFLFISLVLQWLRPLNESGKWKWSCFPYGVYFSAGMDYFVFNLPVELYIARILILSFKSV